MADSFPFTSVQAIANRLTGRWQVGVGLNFGSQLIKEDFIIQLIQQSESKLLAVLSRIYRLPLTQTHSVLAQFVELDVICNMSPLYNNSKENTNESNLVPHACSLAAQLLRQLTDRILVLPGEMLNLDPLPIPVYSGNAIASYSVPVIDWRNEG